VSIFRHWSAAPFSISWSRLSIDNQREGLPAGEYGNWVLAFRGFPRLSTSPLFFLPLSSEGKSFFYLVFFPEVSPVTRRSVSRRMHGALPRFIMAEENFGTLGPSPSLSKLFAPMAALLWKVVPGSLTTFYIDNLFSTRPQERHPTYSLRNTSPPLPPISLLFAFFRLKKPTPHLICPLLTSHVALFHTLPFDPSGKRMISFLLMLSSLLTHHWPCCPVAPSLPSLLRMRKRFLGESRLKANTACYYASPIYIFS